MKLLNDAEVVSLFGDPAMFEREGGGIDPAWEALILRTIKLPRPLKYGDSTLEVKTLRVHRRLVSAFSAAFEALDQAGLFPAIGNISGAYCWRMQRRSTGSRSRHSWAIAVDLDAVRNPFLALVPRVDGRAREIMRAHGFAWGGATIWGGDFPWGRRDPMHWEWAGDVKGLDP